MNKWNARLVENLEQKYGIAGLPFIKNEASNLLNNEPLRVPPSIRNS